MYKEIFENGNVTKHQIENYEYPLVWREDLGIGYLKSTGYAYDLEYWEKYQSYINDLGEKLTLARANFVNSENITGKICDVGIGSGQFVSEMQCYGYDINKFAKRWLEDVGLFGDPYSTKFDVLTFWDVLEHIDDPSIIISKVKHIFLSIPVHADVTSCLASKHLRPSEHIWHFTHDGIINFMNLLGYELKTTANFESVLGREDILSYYFVNNNLYKA